MEHRNRAMRRHLTERYMNKQARIFSWFYGIVEASEKKIRWKKHSPMNCGNSKCNFCMNDRYNPWHNNWTKLTVQERRMSEDFAYTLQHVDIIPENVEK